MPPRPTATLPPLFGGVLMGGESRRMGQPKQLLTWRGLTFLERVVAAVRPHVDALFLLGAGPAPSACDALPRLPDVAVGSGGGPLAGLLAATRHAPDAAWLIVACDLPQLDADAVAWLVAQRAEGHAAVLPRGPAGFVEPLFALYEPAAGALLEDLAARGVRAPSRLDGHPGVATPTLPAALAAKIRNVNRPEDLTALYAGAPEPG
jgi:molybdopterin-guanine dinucleotide biosynthesis protein A